MKEGSIAVKISLGSGVFENQVSSDSGHQVVKFDDNKWHSLVVTRQAREVSGPSRVDVSRAVLSHMDGAF